MVLPDYLIAILIATVPVLIAWLLIWRVDKKIDADKKIDKAELNYGPDFKNETYRVIEFEDGTYAVQRYEITYGIQHYRCVGREWVTLEKRYACEAEALAAINSQTIKKVISVTRRYQESHVPGTGFQPRKQAGNWPVPKPRPPRSE